jgi:hypothetical protein
MKRRKGMPIFKAERNARSLEYNAKVKGRALSHYSKDGIIKCQAEGCEVNDPDMLSLDHINNDGAKDRKLGRGYAGVALYGMLEREKFPEGFQTLCFNHQSKKELERRRAHALSTIILSYLVPTMFFTSYGKDLQCQTQS